MLSVVVNCSCVLRRVVRFIAVDSEISRWTGTVSGGVPAKTVALALVVMVAVGARNALVEITAVAWLWMAARGDMRAAAVTVV